MPSIIKLSSKSPLVMISSKLLGRAPTSACDLLFPTMWFLVLVTTALLALHYLSIVLTNGSVGGLEFRRELGPWTSSAYLVSSVVWFSLVVSSAVISAIVAIVWATLRCVRIVGKTQAFRVLNARAQPIWSFSKEVVSSFLRRTCTKVEIVD